MKYNKFEKEDPTIEMYCRRHNFSKIEKLFIRCNLTNEIKIKYGVPINEECIYKQGSHCMNIDKRVF